MNAKLGLELEKIITESLRKKLAKYRPESKSMPFHTRLLEKIGWHYILLSNP